MEGIQSMSVYGIEIGISRSDLDEGRLVPDDHWPEAWLEFETRAGEILRNLHPKAEVQIIEIPELLTTRIVADDEDGELSWQLLTAIEPTIPVWLDWVRQQPWAIREG